MSRGAGQYGGLSNGPPLSFRWYVGAAATYSSDLSPVGTEYGGAPINLDSGGANFSGGVYVNKRWARSALAGFYHADYSYVTRNTYLNGIQQNLGLNYSNRVSRHVSVGLFTGVSAGRGIGFNSIALNTPGSFGGALSGNFARRSIIGLYPENDFLDASRIFASGGGSVTYIVGPRLSFSGAVMGSSALRHSSTLIDSRGLSGQGDMAYRISRNQTIFVALGVGRTWYTRESGWNMGESAMAGWATQLGRNWSVSLGAGGFRMSAQYLKLVPVDPIVTQILGTTSSIAIGKGTTYQAGGQVEVAGTFRRSGVQFGYLRGMSPGNGVVYGGRNDSVHFGYNFLGIHRLATYLGVYASQLTPYLQDAGRSRYVSAHIGTGFRLVGGLHMTVGGGIARSEIIGGYDRKTWFTSLGVAYSSGDTPLALW
jgi:hypothetical protein